jgi:hypothetical protein
MSSLEDVLDRVQKATGPDRKLDAALARMFDLPACFPAGAYTSRHGEAIALTERLLPGWCWRIGTCCVSDDAWVAPDWNSPVHGAQLRKELGEPVFGTVFDQGVDIDRRPPGNVPLAILEALLTALIAVRDHKAPPPPA